MSLDSFRYDVPLADGFASVCEAWAQGWTPPPRITVSEWADQHRVIAKGSGAEPGRWRTSRTPYLREIMDALSEHSPVRTVSFRKSAQIGATEVGINWACYVIALGLDSMIVSQPVKDLARSWSAGKFEPAVEMMPALAERIESNNTLEKLFPGGTLWVIWANSSNQLRQRTARFLFLDEVDEYPRDLGGQGGAKEQVEARALSYGDRAKIYRACTPTVAGLSNIDADFHDGDQRYYHVPCPHCGHLQPLVIDHLQPDGTFVCGGKGGCGGVIEEHHKERMLAEATADNPGGARWVPANPSADPTHRSYHIWAAYCPSGLGLSWRDIADRRAEADANPAKQASFRNLILGEVFEGERQAQDHTEIERRAEAGVHLGTVPDGALILTAGVDCQHDRFEVQVIGWGRGQHARVIDYAVIPGDPSLPEGYADLDAWLQRSYAKRNGQQVHIRAVAIDGGNWTEMVAQYVKTRVGLSGKQRMIPCGDRVKAQHVYLVRGRSELNSERAVYRPKKSEVNFREQTLARSVGVWGAGTSVLKHIIYGWLNADGHRISEAERTGNAEDIAQRMIRFPAGRGEPFDPLRPDPGALPSSYYEGLTVEYFDLAAKRWICPKGKRNEPLDTFVYALWAALSPAVKLDMVREHEWSALEAELEPVPDLFSAPAHGARAAAAPVQSRITENNAPTQGDRYSGGWDR
jgi:phage terminase large subunit GpA-like protein